METAIFALLCFILIFCLIIFYFTVKAGKPHPDRELMHGIEDLSSKLSETVRTQTEELLHAEVAASANSVHNLQILSDGLKSHFDTLQTGLRAQLGSMQAELKTQRESLEEELKTLRESLEKELKAQRESTEKQLAEIRGTVNEQLQDALDRKLRQSFDSVAEQLAHVQRGLGEMQTLAGNVGDLKNTLTRVKTRGMLGELQLGAILSEILSPEQYAVNVATVKGSSEVVEYAIRLPGDGDECVWLPVDSKFPGDTYHALLDAYDSGDRALIESCGKALESTILSEGKDIASKYIHVPETTEFGIMFLPVEGLYAEAVKRGMIEKLQSRYRISIAGPTTMAALLNSLQMGFRTLAIQKRSSEVWTILGNVKTEFGKYQESLEAVQKRMNQTSEELERLVGVRTRAINKNLAKITENREDREIMDILSQ